MSDGGEAELERHLYAWAARETGVLAAYLASAGAPSEAAAAADVTEASARVAGRVLESLGVLERVEGEYEPTNRALGLMVKRDPRSVGSLPHRLDVIDTLVALPETMETGVPPTIPESWDRNQVGATEAVSAATRPLVESRGVSAVEGPLSTILWVPDGSGNVSTTPDRKKSGSTIRPFLFFSI